MNRHFQIDNNSNFLHSTCVQINCRKSWKYRIYPTKSQITTLENQFFMCRYLYNWNLQERIETYEKERLSVTYNQQQNK
ncbi:MAG: helix-turn-helix domain-containing protein [Desulfobacteraceae bacterium]|nr:helix-turn-helix domain-containing protein [Desulfobacteraceae bacterium]